MARPEPMITAPVLALELRNDELFIVVPRFRNHSNIFSRRLCASRSRGGLVCEVRKSGTCAIKANAQRTDIILRADQLQAVHISSTSHVPRRALAASCYNRESRYKQIKMIDCANTSRSSELLPMVRTSRAIVM